MEDLEIRSLSYVIVGEFLVDLKNSVEKCHMQVYLSRNYIPMVKSPPKHTSPPSIAATFLTTCLMAVLQPSGYSIFYSGDTPIQLSLP